MSAIPGEAMMQLRWAALGQRALDRRFRRDSPFDRRAKPTEDAVNVTEQREQAARLLGVTRRTLERWEIGGADIVNAYAYVGLGYRTGGRERAQRVLELLAQIPLVEGARVAALLRGREP